MTIKVLQLECSNLTRSDERIKQFVSNFVNEFVEISKVKTYRFGLISTFDDNINKMVEDYIAKYFVDNPYLLTYSIFIRVFDNDEEYDKYFNDMIKYAPKNSKYINYLKAYQFNDKVGNAKINVLFMGIEADSIEAIKEWDFYVLVKI